MRRVAAALLLVAPLAAGCYQHTYVVSGTVPEPEASYREWRHHLLGGLVHLSDDVDLRAACPQGVARVDNAIEVADVLFTVLTGFIYAPTTTEVYCQLPPPAPAPGQTGVPVVEQPVIVDPATVPAPAAEPEGAAPPDP